MFRCWKLMTASHSFRGGPKVADLKGTAKAWRNSRVTNARQVSGNMWITTLKKQLYEHSWAKKLYSSKGWRTSFPCYHSNTSRRNILTHFIAGPPLYITDLMLATSSPIRTSNSRMLFNQATIYPVHSQMKQNQQIILFSLFQRQGEKSPQWKHYKKPLK